MNVLQIVENADERYGGPAVSIAFLSKYLKDCGVKVSINSVRKYKEESNGIIADSSLEWNIFTNRISDTLRYSPDMEEGIEKQIVPHQTIIHTNNQWNYPIFCAEKVSTRNNVPLICSIHGSLSSWALGQKKIIKKVFWYFFQGRIFKSAACLHVTNVDELNAVRGLGLKTPAALIPNGIEMKEFMELPQKEIAKSFFDLDAEKKHILFLSRIYPLKGLKYLVDAWGDIAAQYKDWDLLICGPAYDERYLSQIKNEVSKRGLDSRVTFTGMLNHSDRIKAFAAADLFVLPSHTENFGLVVAEAMAAKLPVITTKGAPWAEVEEYGAGWWVDLSTENIRKALNSALACTPSELSFKGSAGHQLVAERYSWQEQTEKMLQVYNWILGKAPRPRFVYT